MSTKLLAVTVATFTPRFKRLRTGEFVSISQEFVSTKIQHKKNFTDQGREKWQAIDKKVPISTNQKDWKSAE